MLFYTDYSSEFTTFAISYKSISEGKIDYFMWRSLVFTLLSIRYEYAKVFLSFTLMMSIDVLMPRVQS